VTGQAPAITHPHFSDLGTISPRAEQEIAPEPQALVSNIEDASPCPGGLVWMSEFNAIVVDQPRGYADPQSRSTTKAKQP